MVICDFFDLDTESIKIPKRVKETSRGSEILLYQDNVPFGGETWVSCFGALPHIDSMEVSRGVLIATLAIKSSHWIGDMNHVMGMPVVPGSLFLIDPGCAHFLLDRESLFKGVKCKPFIGVQIEVSKSDFYSEISEWVSHIENVTGIKAVARDETGNEKDKELQEKILGHL